MERDREGKGMKGRERRKEGREMEFKGRSCVIGFRGLGDRRPWGSCLLRPP